MSPLAGAPNAPPENLLDPTDPPSPFYSTLRRCTTNSSHSLTTLTLSSKRSLPLFLTLPSLLPSTTTKLIFLHTLHSNPTHILTTTAIASHDNFHDNNSTNANANANAK